MSISLFYNCSMTHSEVFHDSFIFLKCIQAFFIRVACLIHKCSMTHFLFLKFTQALFTSVAWLIQKCSMAHLFSWDLFRPFLYVLHDSFRSVYDSLISLNFFWTLPALIFFFGNLLCTLKVSYTYGWVMGRESCPACIYIWMVHESWVMSCTWIRSESCCTSV